MGDFLLGALGVLAFIFLGIPLLLSIVGLVLTAIGATPFFIIDNIKANKQAEARKKQMEETRSNEFYKEAFNFLKNIINTELITLPTFAKTRIPAKWINNIYINFGEFDICVYWQYRDGTEHATTRKNYCDFGFEKFNSLPYFAEVLVDDLTKKFPQINCNKTDVYIDKKYYKIHINLDSEYDKFSPYKK